ncbi:MAG: immunoglobulin domain-containing protein, partial [Bacteroidota bacterium]
MAVMAVLGVCWGVGASPAQTVVWTAYNDLAWTAGQADINITKITTQQSGVLKKRSDGTNTTVRLTVSGAAPASDPGTGAEPASGTDAYAVFNGNVSCTGFIYYSTTPSSNPTFSLQGLNPGKWYTIVFYGNRNAYPTWERGSEATISDCASFKNRSSLGTDSAGGPLFSGPSDPSTVLPAQNTDSGWVARFEEISAGSDSDLVITVTFYGRAGEGYKGKYASALMVQEVTPPSSGYLLNLDTRGSGSVTKTPDSASYSPGTVVTLTAVPDAHHRFVRWEGALSGSGNPAQITMDGPKDVTAIFFPGTGNKTRFMIVGDSRGTSSSQPVNGPILEHLAHQAAVEGAEFWVFPGDLVNGWAAGTPTPPTNLNSELLTWQGYVSEAREDSVRIYPVRGNHEAWNWDYHSEWKYAWSQAFSGPWTLPQNGPDSQKNLSYYVRHGNSTGDSVLVIGMDQFWSDFIPDPREPAGTMASRGHIDTTWLRTVLESKGTIKHVFVTGHMPAFRCGRRLGLEADTLRRNSFWRILEEYGVKVYFCAHTHFYSRARIGNGTADTTDDVQQMVVGTAGASFYRSLSAPWFPGATYWDGFIHDSTYGGTYGPWTPALQHVDTITYGYVLVEIDGDVATFTWKEMTPGGVVTDGGDTWSYVAGPPPCTPPSITTHPADQTVQAGQPASFTVAASGTAPLSYQWYRNADSIPGAVTATCTIPSVSPADTGFYRCRVRNVCGSAFSNPAHLGIASCVQTNIVRNPSF